MIAEDNRHRVHEVKRRLADPMFVAQQLGLQDGARREGGGLKICCPWHKESNPSCSLKLREDGALSVKCFSCQQGGDVLSLIAIVRGLDIRTDFAKIIEEAEQLAGIAPAIQARPPAAKGRPDPRQVAQLWQLGLDPAQGAAELQARALKAADLADRGVARLLPEVAALPPFAVFRRRTWIASGHRWIVPMFGAGGAMESIHARALAGPDPKALSPAGCLLAGLVFADAAGQDLLRQRTAPPGGVVICEGVPDFWTLATQWSEAHEDAPAVLGVIAGSWNDDIAQRVPDGTRVLIWTHTDASAAQAGQKYAAGIARSLQGRCDVRIVKQDVPEGRKKAPDANDILQAEGRDGIRKTLERALQAEAQPIAFARASDVELSHALLQVLQERPLAWVEGGPLRYDPKRGIWDPVTEAEMVAILKGFEGAPVGENGRALAMSWGKIRGAIAITSAHLQHKLADPQFSSSAWRGITCQNGFVVVDQSGAACVMHAPEQHATTALQLPYDAQAPRQRWMQFLDEVFRGDPSAAEKQQLLQEFAGACLCGLATRYQRALMLSGEGENGKSVYIEVLSALFPKEAITAIAPQLFANEYRRAALQRSRLNAVAEIPESDVIASDSFKAIVVGDQVDARRIHQPPYNYRPIAGHIFSANRLPSTNDHTHAFWRRFLLVRWPRRFAAHEIDRQLAKKLIKHELPGILAWALQGAVRLINQGQYTEPEGMVSDLQTWARSTDQVATFAEEVLDPTEQPYGLTQASSLLYGEYSKWAKNYGYSPMNNMRFSERLERLGFTKTRRNTGIVWFCAFRSSHAPIASPPLLF